MNRSGWCIVMAFSMLLPINAIAEDALTIRAGTAMSVAECERWINRTESQLGELREFMGEVRKKGTSPRPNYTRLPHDFRLDEVGGREPLCVVELGLDECSGEYMMEMRHYPGQVIDDGVVGWTIWHIGDFGLLSSGLRQGMDQAEVEGVLGAPAESNAQIMIYPMASEYEGHEYTERLQLYFREGALFAAEYSNGTGC